MIIKILDDIQALFTPLEENETFSNKERIIFWSILSFVIAMIFFSVKK